jgi:hypothetical protein
MVCEISDPPQRTAPDRNRPREVGRVCAPKRSSYAASSVGAKKALRTQTDLVLNV